MRVIAGSARSIPLLSPDGDGTRPTTDRIKETLFNILRDDIYECSFLDLFAGSGQIGIEALSRGAKKSFFVEKNKKATALIKKNLEKTKLLDKAVVIGRDVMAALPLLCEHGPFDIIFMDPPYDCNLEEKVIEAIGEYGLLEDGGMIIVEAALDRKLDIDLNRYTIVKEKTYKTNKHTFITVGKNTPSF